MSRYSFILKNRSVCETPAFSEARTDELKLLIALMELKGCADADVLSELAGISRGKCSAAIEFWQEAGVIAPAEIGDYGSTVSEEFGARSDDELFEKSGEQIASEIRNKKLAALFGTLAEFAEKPELSPAEIKKITQLTSVYGLSDDYIAELASYMKEKGTLTIFKLYNRAVKLSEEGVDTAEALEARIKCDKTHIEIRVACGIYDRSLTEQEKASFDKWTGEFGYSIQIIKAAYDQTVECIGKYRRDYMDKILSSWHSAGCKTLEDCISNRDSFRAKPRENSSDEQKPLGRSVRRQKPAAPKFGDINPEEALKKALSRSFWDKKEN